MASFCKSPTTCVRFSLSARKGTMGVWYPKGSHEWLHIIHIQCVIRQHYKLEARGNWTKTMQWASGFGVQWQMRIVQSSQSTSMSPAFRSHLGHRRWAFAPHHLPPSVARWRPCGSANCLRSWHAPPLLASKHQRKAGFERGLVKLFINVLRLTDIVVKVVVICNVR
jgi:hypothetical protein